MNDTTIITVTLDPSLDRTLVGQFVALGYENHFFKRASLDPAGRGVNVSRALYRLGCPTRAVILLGRDSISKAYTTLIQEEGFDILVMQGNGTTRSSVIIKDTGTNTETHLIEESAEMTAEDVAAVAELLEQIIEPDNLVMFGGQLPNGVAPDTYAYLTNVVHNVGGKVALFSTGRSHEADILARPELFIMNNKEAEGYFNYPVRTVEDQYGVAFRLKERGAQNVLIVDQAQMNAVMLTAHEQWRLVLPIESVGTTSGVWEAMIAGLLASSAFEDAPARSLKIGGAAALYTFSQLGNTFGTLADLEPYLDDVSVTPLELSTSSIDTHTG